VAKVRCRHAACQGRQTLARHPDSYVRLPKCKRCGRKHGFRVDRYRQERETGPKAPRACRCLGYSFPHAHGRGWCDHNPRLTAADLEARWTGGVYR
jgi:hypothetical protein